MRVDVVVLGSGPAGLAAASACGRAGLSVALISPTLAEMWPNRYGVFSDDTLIDLPAVETFPEVFVDSGTERTFEREYVRVDQDALRSKLLSQCAESGVAAMHGTAQQLVHHRSHIRVEWSEGEIYCKAVIDATGHRSMFTERSDDPYAFQTAFGKLIRSEQNPLRAPCVLIDYSPVGDASDNPTFLYGMALGDDRYFVEETVLTAPDVADFDWLQRRLDARLHAAGVKDYETIEVERCIIPMAGGLPKPDGRVIGFGGAGSMVHPATGYLLSRVLNYAPTLANVIRTYVDQHTDVIAKEAIVSLWDDDARKRYALFQFGGRFLGTCNRDEIAAFFDAFFKMETARWSAFMSGELTSKEVRGVMLEVFGNAGLQTKAKLIAASFSDPSTLLKGLFTGA